MISVQTKFAVYPVFIHQHLSTQGHFTINWASQQKKKKAWSKIKMHDYSLLCCDNKQNDKTFCLPANTHNKWVFFIYFFKSMHKCPKQTKQPATTSHNQPQLNSFFLFTLVRWWQAIIMLRRYQLQLHGMSWVTCMIPPFFSVCVKAVALFYIQHRAWGKREQMFMADPWISSQLKIWRLITFSFVLGDN